MILISVTSASSELQILDSSARSPRNPLQPSDLFTFTHGQNLKIDPKPSPAMEKSEIARPITTILDDSNYITWTNQMQSFLIGRKLWRIVTGDITKPTKQDKEDDSKFIERLEEWDNKNHPIITWLSNTSIPAIHTQFDAFENAKEL
ncbi:UBN2_3 domain-containing protein [Cucumis melo var. makuwa]|uniref:UBN2_3 domain-containing protein n=1 Tax=Cucumis melo var. makuwa TaxID=1194695 RepID=A0A5A7U5F5_CUCMM|nr:UBN2_3 domain-containing protein [Cucumis melo var. makuwa]TYK02681.1 UBN2_3 domain-containing protein [Cucumis melo var. makuwa]